jgi:SNF2 family DNA or RNA helicase
MPLNPKFEVGENVLINSNGKIGTVNKILIRADNVGYRVTIEGKTSAYPEKYLEKIIDEEQEIYNNFELNEFAGVEEFRLFQTWFRLKRPIEGHFYSYLASRTIFNPYQFKPLSKFISPGSEERLFIADEVGVGKTIETGIILTELIARKKIDRKKPILIVCPNSLGPKWVDEMQERFNFRFYLHENGHTLRNLLNSVLKGYIPDGMEWSIVSFSLLRSQKNLEFLQNISSSRDTPLWSMVIIDEAHHMRNTLTKNYKLGLMLSDLTETMLMLSATPLNLKDEDLFNQMHILNPSMFPDQQTFSAMLSPVKSINRCRRLLLENKKNENGKILKELFDMSLGPLGEAISSHRTISSLKEDLLTGKILTASEIALYDKTLLSLSPLDQSFTRTLKREAFDHPAIREPIKLPVLLSKNEKKFYNSVIQLVQDVYLEKCGDPRALGFITNIPRRMVTSCIPAMKEYLKWCIKNDLMILDESNFENNQYFEEDVDDDSNLKQIPLSEELRKQFIALYNMAEKLKYDDTKYQEFSKLVRRLLENLENPQLIVFSFFVRTLEYLKIRLTEEGYRVGLICGKVPLRSEGEKEGRYEIIKAFEKKELDILLSSEVGGEGLDFQFCQAIINYDLPYNPMKIEQRIGRIDRFGQTADKIFVASMYLKDTVDENIYSALYDRIKIVQDSVGDLEPILCTKLLDLQKDIISGSLSESQLEKRTKEIEFAIEKAKMEKQKFEENRNELLGDEHFNSILQNLDKQSEFVQPADASKLTSICLNLWDACKYEEKDVDRGVIKLSKEIKSNLEQFVRKPGSEGSNWELNQLIEGRNQIPVLFNGSLANQFRDYAFLPPCGFWIQFLLGELESKGKISKVFSLSADDAEIPISNGDYIVPLFEVVIDGFRKELDLAAIPVSINEKIISECDFKELSRLIGKQNIESNNHELFELNVDLDEFVDIGRYAVEKQFDKRKDELEMENEYRIKARISSIQKGSEIKIKRFEEEIIKHRSKANEERKEPSEKFILLTESRISVIKKRRDSMIKEIQSKRDLSLSSKLVGIVLLRVA